MASILLFEYYTLNRYFKCDIVQVLKDAPSKNKSDGQK